MAFIDAHRKRWNVAVICRVLEFSERTYYASKTRPASLRAEADKEHKKQIRRVWENNYRAYGARRIYKQLLRENYTIARCQVERLMAAMGIHGVQRGKRQFTTVQDRNASRPPDLVRRNFQAERPNELWLADIERHEALLNRAVVKGHRLRTLAGARMKLGAARPWERREGWQAAPTKPGRTSTVRWGGSGEQDRKV